MSAPDASRDFELAGRDDEAVVRAYHRNLGEVTAGCIPELIRAAGSSPDTVINAVSSGTVRAAAVLKRQNEADLKTIRASLRERIVSYEQDGICAVPAPACVIMGYKPQ